MSIKITIRNRKGHKKGILIVASTISQEEAEHMRQAVKKFETGDSKLAIINIPENAKWQYIAL